MTGDIVSADATLVGQLGVVWVRGLEVTEEVGWLGHLNPVSIHTVKLGGGELKPWYLPAPWT